MSQQNNSSNIADNVDSLLTPMEDVIEAWEEEDYETCSQKCLFLLKKRKQAMIMVGGTGSAGVGGADKNPLMTSIQKLLLQCWLHLEQYQKIQDWVQSNDNAGMHKSLALYANYRSDQYEKVSKSASATSAEGTTTMTTLEQHLLAQSYFHLNQPVASLKIYKDLLPQYDADEDEDDEQAKMEVLANALAVLTSTAIPFLPSNADNNSWLEKAENFLEDQEQFSDLAFNLGTLQCLESSNPSKDWLEFAEDNVENEDEDLPAIDTNLTWFDQFWQREELEDISYSQITTEETSARAAVANLNQTLLDGNARTMPTKPHPKWTTLQVRMYWYNRAVTQYKAGKMVECQETCQFLKKSLNGGGGSNEKTKKQSASSNVQHLWWESRADVLIAHASASKDSKKAISKLEQRLEFLKSSQQSSAILDHAIAHVQLNLYILQNPTNNTSSKQIRKVLTSLPTSIQSSPAVEATLNAIGGKEEESASSKDKASKSPEEEALTLFRKGQFKKSADLYRETLPSPSQSDEDQLAHYLWCVQALSRSDQLEEAEKIWNEIEPLLHGTVDGRSTANGEALEQKELPRSSTSSTKTLIGTSTESKKPKRSKESVLRQRTKKREAYLKKLEEKGEYNPERPTKPNPERWIPKHERSRNRRGQRGGGPGRSHQGGGSAADAQRLDAAARRAGTSVPANSGPSTANMKAVGGGKQARRGRR